ncbi:hypothetical protein QFC20_006964 [Naganishia adeliensis]|uniref:Uncharacterized protein n=1 Tax=Naganishia adeliensis TaxID=92952 RepID=A0ACC2V697_9TREE|nr:hypothetical protein QFC20_006964 [Naganishia adeliensis]
MEAQSTAVLPIVLGSFASVKCSKAPRDGELQEQIPHPDDVYYGPEDDQDEDGEKVALRESPWFPLIASLWIRYGSTGSSAHIAGSDPINTVTENDRETRVPLPSTYREGMPSFISVATLNLYIPTELLHITYTKSDTIMIPIPIVIAIPAIYTYLGKRRYIANMLSSTFAYSAIEAIKLDGVVTGAALLARWFLHDIFWVFGTPVMENSAKGLDAPIKVSTTSPRATRHVRLVCRIQHARPGDLVLPGVIISLALRHNYANHVQRQLKAEPGSTPTKRDRYVKPHFFAVLVACAVGLCYTSRPRAKDGDPADKADKGIEQVAEPEKTVATAEEEDVDQVVTLAGCI